MSYVDELERKYIVALGDVKALTEEVQTLRATIAQMSAVPVTPTRFGLTRQEEKLFVALMAANSEKTKEQLLAVAYADRYGMDDEPDIKIIDVFVCKLRKKLGPHGVRIETHFGRGYAIPPESKAAVRRMNDEDVGAVVAKSSSRRA